MFSGGIERDQLHEMGSLGPGLIINSLTPTSQNATADELFECV